jgi:putative Ca2+/H+ antiporter (TMEM165/GDT1 family)
MEAFLISTGIVALAEIGDKTQLLSLVLAARFRQAQPIIFGILVATLANHAGAAAVGAWLLQLVGPDAMRWILAVSFAAMGAWCLFPDKLHEGEVAKSRFGVFGTTLVAFFLVEMGDKTQIATVALAAQHAQLVAVIAGTTLGMLIANVPVVLFGERITRWLPLRWVRTTAAAGFLVLAALTLLSAMR